MVTLGFTGIILVFLTGLNGVLACCRLINEESKVLTSIFLCEREDPLDLETLLLLLTFMAKIPGSLGSKRHNKLGPEVKRAAALSKLKLE